MNVSAADATAGRPRALASALVTLERYHAGAVTIDFREPLWHVGRATPHRGNDAERHTTMSELAELEGIPDASKALWTKLVAEDLRPVHELFKEVKSYQQSISQRSTVQDAEVDPTLAKSLSEASLRLLGTLNESTPENTRRLVQAAVRYFIIEDDADSDLDSILGLDDDAEVMNAVLKKLGHDKWLVDVP